LKERVRLVVWSASTESIDYLIDPAKSDKRIGTAIAPLMVLRHPSQASWAAFSKLYLKNSKMQMQADQR
jgi:hypothetical protein